MIALVISWLTTKPLEARLHATMDQREAAGKQAVEKTDRDDVPAEEDDPDILAKIYGRRLLIIWHRRRIASPGSGCKGVRMGGPWPQPTSEQAASAFGDDDAIAVLDRDLA